MRIIPHSRRHCCRGFFSWDGSTRSMVAAKKRNHAPVASYPLHQVPTFTLRAYLLGSFEACNGLPDSCPNSWCGMDLRGQGKWSTLILAANPPTSSTEVLRYQPSFHLSLLDKWDPASSYSRWTHLSVGRLCVRTVKVGTRQHSSA